MITLIVPTFNRAYALEQVLDTFYQQEQVNEIVFVDDASVDQTQNVIEKFSKKYPLIKTIYLKNERNMGASYGRWFGVESSSNDYILFCDDDEFLESNYASVCLAKYKTGVASIISGRHFYRLPGEELNNAIKRFGLGLEKGPVFGKVRFKIYTDAIFEKDIFIPFTHGIFFTTKSLINQFKIDSYYSKGNGFREESDLQVKAFLSGHKILMTNDTHCIHMNMSEVR
ncbi:MAG: glycosyltransferase family 2 protein, partial [Bacteriovorax sp.]